MINTNRPKAKQIHMSKVKVWYTVGVVRVGELLWLSGSKAIIYTNL